MNIEEFIYCYYKDQKIVPRHKFVKEVKSKFRGININDIYARITKYQIEKYGSQLDKIDVYRTRYEIDKSTKRHYSRRKYNGLHKKYNE